MIRQVLLVAALTSPAVGAHAADVQAGKQVFKSKCASCHIVGPSARAFFGPQLNGVIGRRAGSTPDYKYSKAMKSSGIVWTEKNLAAFLKDPGEVVPGTSMRFWGMTNEKQIADLLAYLRTFR